MNQDMNEPRLPDIDTTDDLAKILGRTDVGKARAEPKNFVLDNEVDNLLSNYGVDVETSKERSYKDDRLERMRKRVLTESPDETQDIHQKSPMAFIIWSIGCALLVVLLLVQYTIFNVNSLVRKPSTKATLSTVCKILSCSLPSADVNNLHIGNIEHKASSVGNPNTESDIVASITSLNDKKQLYPNFKITIHGFNGLLGELVIQPKDYLLSEKQIEMASSESFFMLTVPINNNEIMKVDVVPFY